MTTFAERRAVYFDDDLNPMMRAWGATVGLHGARGGWIYTASGGTRAQGWWTVWNENREAILDWLTRDLTAFDSFEQMLSETAPSYRPSIRLTNAKSRCLVAAYDAVQAARGDPRRAYTYCPSRKAGAA
jgi:hypothetical protein